MLWWFLQTDGDYIYLSFRTQIYDPYGRYWTGLCIIDNE